MIKIDKVLGYTHDGSYIFQLDEDCFEFTDYGRFNKWALECGVLAEIDAYMDIGCIDDIDKLGIIVSKKAPKETITLCALKWG